MHILITETTKKQAKNPLSSHNQALSLSGTGGPALITQMTALHLKNNSRGYCVSHLPLQIVCG